MNRFKLRPKTIEAIRWSPGVFVPLAIESPSGAVYVNTPTGKVALLPGDYVILNQPGGQQVMHEAEFVVKYEPEAAKQAAKPLMPAKKAAKKKVAKKKATKK